MDLSQVRQAQCIIMFKYLHGLSAHDLIEILRNATTMIEIPYCT